MPRSDAVYVCQSCGAVHAKWAGRCDDCGSWNSLQEETPAAPLGTQASGPKRSTRRSRLELVDLGSATDDPPRFETGMAEFDRVAGGGLVPGSAVLVGGDPGIGKSTLLLQAAARLARAGQRAVYISGEEAADQVRRRARRLGLADAPVALAAETSLESILDGLKSDPPAIAVLDSIQTLWSDQLAAAPGTVAQVRACAQELVRFAKKRGTAVILVGHVTKDGQIAGPRVVEHMVDAVLYFEGERSHQFRILRAVKNRFGPTDEIGVFEMGDAGLGEVANPSALFLDGRGAAAPGTAVFAGMEGTRPVLTEIQALVAPAAFGTPRRAVVGWDSGRLAMVLAVLEARCGIGFGGKDVYLNVAGGLKIAEPAADLAVAAALVSSAFDVALPAEGVVFGEIALSGDVRPVGRAEARLKEAAKLGFTRALAPAGIDGAGLQVTGIDTVHTLVTRLDPGPQ
ncbi:MAG: DNA repair protein RadA [Oceanicaulis sp.]|uniref:DNA repair protein RadA n=1 Tax=Glycocaulis sp. TaxID=1969725 RepID=UPI0025B86508|nr:DNA repair protein RadA [Glycocaulis sp.]MCC5981115.1 DNA repair protein RadA [Oceanicaulis sp.]MCH8521878.1 DNA repair protein RadA [Glycocaulis sp.]